MPSCPLNKHGSTPTKTSHFDCQRGTVTRSSQSLKPNVVRWLEHCWAGQLIPPKRKGVDEFWMSNSSSCCCNCHLSMTMLELYGIVVNVWVQSWMIGKMRCFCWLFDENLVGNPAPQKNAGDEADFNKISKVTAGKHQDAPTEESTQCLNPWQQNVQPLCLWVVPTHLWNLLAAPPRASQAVVPPDD